MYIRRDMCIFTTITIRCHTIKGFFGSSRFILNNPFWGFLTQLVLMGQGGGAKTTTDTYVKKYFMYFQYVPMFVNKQIDNFLFWWGWEGGRYFYFVFTKHTQQPSYSFLQLKRHPTTLCYEVLQITPKCVKVHWKTLEQLIRYFGRDIFISCL